MKKIGKYLIILSSLALFIGCVDDEVEIPIPKECANINWDYGQNGPDQWSSLCGEFDACGGEFQSPIAIQDNNTEKDTVGLIFSYSNSLPNMVYDDFTITFTTQTKNRVKIGGDEGNWYKLQQFHFHVPAEHTINDEPYPIEIHFVHVNEKDNNDFAHISVFVTEGDEGYENYFFKLYEEKFSDPSFEGEDPFELVHLVPEDKSFYKYQGSMTSPPCFENVTWYVLKNPIKCSARHIKDMEDLFKDNGNNARPLQVQGDRVVYKFDDVDTPTE